MTDSHRVRTGRPDRQAALALGEHVVVVADSLFIERGYGATSMTMVAARAHVGKQTLYSRFPDKAALFREVIRRRIDAIFSAPHAPESSDADPLGDLKSLAGTALDVVLDPEFAGLYRIVIAEALAFPELSAGAANHWGSLSIEASVGLVERAQQMGLCRAGDPREIAKFLIWSTIGLAFYDVMTGAGSPFGADADKRAHVDRAWGFFLEGVAPRTLPARRGRE